MIQDGDRVLVCLSGGKDSLSLLHALRQYQHYIRARGVEFELGAVTIDPKSSSYNPAPLIPYLKSLGIPYFYEEQGLSVHKSVVLGCRVCMIWMFCGCIRNHFIVTNRLILGEAVIYYSETCLIRHPLGNVQQCWISRLLDYRG